MNKWLKRGLIAVASILVILVLVVLSLPFVIDPNSFKGPLERAAMGQNIRLNLEGPISWQFYPQLGLSLEGVVVAPLAQPDTPVAQADRGTAAVALIPLFSGQVLVDELVLDSLAVNLIVDEQGVGNWESLGKRDQQAIETPEESTAEDQGELNLSVQRIAINNASLNYQDRRTGESAQLRDLTVQLRDVNLDNRLFPLAIGAAISHSTLPNPLRFRFDGHLKVNSALDSFTLEDGELSAVVPNATDAELTATLAGEASLQPELAYRVRIAIEPFNAKALLDALGQTLSPTADPAALTDVAFVAEISGTDSTITSDELTLTLDDTRVTGSVGAALADAAAPTITLELTGDAINVDRYLAPAEAEALAATPSPQANDASPLPLDSLRAINLNLTVTMDQFVAMDMPVTQARVAVTGNNGLWQLTDLSANFYQGTLRSEGQLDARPARGDTATLRISARMDQLSLQPLLTDLAEFGDLSGVLSGELQAETRAATSGQLLENLTAAFVFTSPELTFQGVNAEYFYCQMATQLNDGDMPDAQWPSRTRISEVEGQLTFNQQRLTIANMIAYVENLVLTANGYLDLRENDYRVRAPMRLAQQRTSASGCLIESNFLQNRQVDVLGCRGPLDELDFGEQCRLDSGAVADLARQAVRYNVEKRTDEKKEEVREELQDRLRERLGSDDDDDNSGRRILRDLLNR
ncbi:MAG: AsmA family protein [Cellvibrionaceae bacterium]